MRLTRSATRGAPVSLFALLLTSSALAAQSPAAGVVAGRITVRVDSASVAPASGANVLVLGTARSVTTGDDGRFSIDRIPAGQQTLRVRMLGYRVVDREVRIRAGDTARVEILMQTEAQILAEVRTRARSEDIEKFDLVPRVATVSIDAAAMKGIPSVGEPDVVRVAQLLPGVVSRNDFNTGLVVRGGEADQNLVLLDGHPVHNPFHLGGLFSTFMDATVGGMELMTGAFPARFGGRLSSVLDVRSAEDARPGAHLTADVSALATTARLSGGIGEGKGSWSIAGRRTYADAVQRVFTDDIFPYHFRDFHGRATWSIREDLRLAVTGYTGRDVLDANLAEFDADSQPSRASEGSWAFDWGNQVLGVSLAKELRPGARLLGVGLGGGATFEQRVSTSGFSTRLDLGEGAAGQRSSVRDVRASGSVQMRGDAHELSVGYDAAASTIRYSSGSSGTGTVEFDLVQKPTTLAAWIDDLWRVSPRLLVQAGVRAERLSTREWTALSPRVSLKMFATPDLAFTAGAGRVTQTMHSLAGDGPLRYFEIWLASDPYIPVSTAWHWIAGVERRVGDVGLMRVEGYVKQYDRVMEANWSEDPSRRGDEFFTATGTSYGVDALARWQPNERLSGWVSYSYGVSARERGGVRWAPGHDRRHDLDAVATWRVSKYRLGARVGYASGTPYTPIVGEIVRRVYDPSRDLWGTGDPRLFVESIGGARNAARFPAVHRVDLDVSRELQVRGATVSPYLSVVNAYNAKNVFVYLYNYSTDRPTRRAISQFPVLPSLGVRVAF